MLSSLSQAGTNATLSTPAVPVTPPAEPTVSKVGDSPEAPQVDPVEQKVLAFVRICHVTDGLTYKEIAGGTSLLISAVRHALESLVANGTLKHSGEDESNYRRYMLAVSEPVQSAQPVEDFRTSSQVWDYQQRQRVAVEEAAKRPPEPKRYSPSESEVTAALDAEAEKKTTLVLSPEERQSLDISMRNRRPINQQQFIKR